MNNRGTSILNGLQTSVALVSLGLFLFISSALLFRSVEDYDIWFHLRIGKDLVESGKLAPGPAGFPYYETYTFTDQGKRWVAHSWLSDIGLYGLYARFGAAGLVAYRVVTGYLLFGLIGYLLYRNCRDPALTGVLLLTILFFNLKAWAIRPYLISYLFTLLFFLILRQPRLSVRHRLLLIILNVGWANLHVGFTMGYLMYAIYFIATLFKRKSEPGAIRSELVWLAVFMLSGLVNPNGYHLLLYPLKNFALRDVGMIEEWKSIFHSEPAFYGTYLAVIAAMVGLLVKPIRQKQYFFGLFSLVLIFLGITRQRFLPYTGIIVLVGITDYYNYALASNLRKRLLVYAALVLISCSYIAVLRTDRGYGYVFFRYAFRPELGNIDYPIKAAAFIKQNGLEPNLFNEQRWGGFLMFFLPEYKIFTNGEAVLHGDLFAVEKKIRECASGYEQELDRYRINTIILSKFGYTKLLMALAAGDQWQVSYEDYNAVIFRRKTLIAVTK